MKTPKDYEILSHGIEHSQYFQGCGTAFTEFTDVATGIGDTEAEAFEDALDMLVQQDWDTEGISDKDGVASATTSMCKGCDCEFDEYDDEGCELHYFVSIRVN